MLHTFKYTRTVTRPGRRPFDSKTPKCAQNISSISIASWVSSGESWGGVVVSCGDPLVVSLASTFDPCESRASSVCIWLAKIMAADVGCHNRLSKARNTSVVKTAFTAATCQEAHKEDVHGSIVGTRRKNVRVHGVPRHIIDDAAVSTQDFQEFASMHLPNPNVRVCVPQLISVSIFWNDATRLKRQGSPSLALTIKLSSRPPKQHRM